MPITLSVMDWVLDTLAPMRPWEAAAWLLLVNVGMFLLSLLAGEVLVRRFTDRRVTAPPEPLEAMEVLWSATCVALNGGVAFAGWLLLKAGVITIVREAPPWRVALDVLVLLAAMDFLMYVFHRLAHVKWIYPVVHSTHHRYDKPRPLNLFVLNPFEVLGFGALWLALISLYPCTWAGMLIYLALNLAFGTLGHLGVEPFPASMKRWPLLRNLGSSTFHAGHHQDGRHNFGFYTDVWDRLFNTRAS